MSGCRILLLAAKLVLSVGILYAISRFIPVSQVRGALSSADPAYVAAAFLVSIGARYVGALRLKLLATAQGMQLSVGQIFRTVLVTGFYGLFLPGVISSGAIMWHKLCRIDRKPAETLVVIGLNRLVDTLVVVSVGLIFWLSDIMARLDPRVGLLLLVLVIGLSICYALVISRTVSATLSRGLERPGGRPAALLKWGRNLLATIENFQGMSRRSELGVFGLSVARLGLGVVSAGLFAISLDLSLPLTTLVWTLCFAQLIAVIPVSFSGLGLREGGLALLLIPYGIAAADSVAWSLLFFAGQLFVGSIGLIIEARAQFRSSIGPAQG